MKLKGKSDPKPEFIHNNDRRDEFDDRDITIKQLKSKIKELQSQPKTEAKPKIDYESEWLPLFKKVEAILRKTHCTGFLALLLNIDKKLK